ncbi:MAG TPA: diguanylate cyclase [Solirubrobacteraceae bacterium]|nr:diguanylate cyclase [Solirubrobacteraceae bacterium]
MRTGAAHRSLLRIVIGVLALGVVAHGLNATTGIGSDVLFADWIYNLLMWGGVALCLARTLSVRAERGAWAALTAGLAVWSAADLTWTLHYNHLDEAPYPNFSDVLYLLTYPLTYIGLVLLLRARLRPVRASLWLDGLVSGLTLAALTTALLFGPILAATEGSAAAVAVTLAYPVGDLLLLCSVGVALTITGWRPGRSWGLIALSLVLTAIGDVIYSYVENTGAYAEGTLLDTIWPASVLAMAAAAWQPHRRGSVRPDGNAVLIPATFALVALGVLVYGWVADLPPLAGALAAAGLLAAMARGGLTFRENVLLLRHSRVEALTDGLSGLANRRRLMSDLEDTLASATVEAGRTLVFFDLDGFKSYNDAFGHNAGDALLARLGSELAASVFGRGEAYRLGGDEFCILLEDETTPGDPIVARAALALSEQGEGFTVTASYGVVQIPAEAESSEAALQMADGRMYAHKDSRRATSRRQARDVLVQVLAEREPELRRHMADVSELAVRTARVLEIEPEQLDVISRAAELHDIGKVAVPDGIIHKPGPLDDAEWRIMRQHTLVGERILAAAPALTAVARLVRLSHERWDGTGYPDRLAGEDIPLGARIIAVCDTYDAMTSERAYAKARSHDDAIAELRRYAGTQFDARVVDAFCAANPVQLERELASA